MTKDALQQNIDDGAWAHALVVDDEPLIGRLVRRALVTARIDVTEARDGLQALSIMERERVDLVITDVRMPGLSGLGLLERLRATHPSLPVVIISGSDEVASKQMALDLGAFDFLRKPLDVKQLRDSAVSALDWGRAHSTASFAREILERRQGAILVVDDYADARATLRELLEEEGHAVIEAANGRQALDVLTAREAPEVSLILLDLAMPVMDGWKLIETLQSYLRLSRIPVVVISAQPRRQHPQAFGAVVGSLQVPYERGKLLTLVNSCVSAA
ncbi:MAG TPA: response regulator [Polyangiaceae bacterium]|nr:response regulator [Polyangiaceae bacterium]